MNVFFISKTDSFNKCWDTVIYFIWVCKAVFYSYKVHTYSTLMFCYRRQNILKAFTISNITATSYSHVICLRTVYLMFKMPCCFIDQKRTRTPCFIQLNNAYYTQITTVSANDVYAFSTNQFKDWNIFNGVEHY